MPPRGGRGLTEEQKNDNFNAFKASEEYAQCEIIFKARTTEGHELKEMQLFSHPGTDDITGDWQPVLNALFKLVEVTKHQAAKLRVSYNICRMSRRVNSPINRFFSFRAKYVPHYGL